MRTKLCLVAVLTSLTPSVAAQTLPAKLTMLTAGVTCPQRPVADSDTVWVAATYLPHNPKRPDAPQKLELTVPGPPGIGSVEPQPSAATTLRFYLDTTGFVDLCSAEVLAETNREWTLTVASFLSKRHFTPAENSGHLIRILMTVEFIRRYPG